MAFNNKKILAIIPARGGSKGLKKKNIVSLNGKPLIYYSIIAGLKSQNIDSVLVSTDDKEILKVAKEYGTDVLKRPDQLATDSASMNQVILHVLESVNSKGKTFDLVVLLQPTSPLRTSNHIDEAFELLNKYNTTSLISVYSPEKSPYKCFIRDKSGYLIGLIDNEAPFMNRQDLPEVCYPNGAIYIFSVVEFLKENCIPVNRVIPLVMTEQESIDIDTQNDCDMAEKIMKRTRDIKKLFISVVDAGA